MATYYVSTAGSDSWVGSAGSPWLTPYKAWATMVAGDTAYFANGTYACNNSEFTTKHSGAAGSPITFASTNRRLAVLRSDDDITWAFAGSTDYITLSELTVQGRSDHSRWIVDINGAEGITLHDCDIGTTLSTCVMARNAVRGLSITDCAVHQETYTASLDDICIIGDGGVTGTISGCEIYNTFHVGVYISTGVADTFEIHDNIIHDTNSHGVQFGDVESVGVQTGGIVYDNTLYNIGTWHEDAYSDKNFFYIQYSIDNVTIHHNTGYHSTGHAINIYRLDHCHTLGVYNNTFYDTGTSGDDNFAILTLYNDSAATASITALIFRNNIWHNLTTDRPVYAHYDTAETAVRALVTLDYDDWYIPNYPGTSTVEWFGLSPTWATWNGTTQEAHGITGTPMFTNAASADFTLQSTSPCIDAGTAVGYYYDGDAPDMGAWEYAGTGSPPAYGTSYFGMIPSDLAIPPLYSIRRNAAGDGWEAFSTV